MEYMEARGPKKGSHRKLSHMMIHHGDSGGHMVEHHYSSGHPPERHIFGAEEGHKLVAHVVKHMKIAAESPGGKPEHELAEEEPAEKKVSRSAAEERGED